MSKPLIVFVFPTERSGTSTRYGGFARRLQKAGGLEDKDVLTVALENLIFIIRENKEAEVIDSVSGRSMAEADFVYMKSNGDESAALATYLFHRGIPFMDTASLYVRGTKLATAFRMWGAGIRVPYTFYLRNPKRFSDLMRNHIPAELGERFIVKDANGAKGQMNFRVTAQQAVAIINENPDVQFVCQRFVENDGDYRIGVYGSQARFVIKRTGSAGSHLNNTSAGGTAEYVSAGSLSRSWVSIAEKAAEAANLQIAGVDLIIDKSTQKALILEVNQGSQIVTGVFTEQNMQAFNDAIDEAVKIRHAKARLLPATVIGRRVVAKIPNLHIDKIVAKIDTGAYTSSLHAENIHIEIDESGDEELVFTIGASDRVHYTAEDRQTMRTKDFFKQAVRSSNGHIEYRYSIKTKIVIEKKRFIITLTLSDRSSMGYPLLIGRRALRSRFLVNVELNEEHMPDWKY